MVKLLTGYKNQKRSDQPWDNVSKKDDRMYKLLKASVKIRDNRHQRGISLFIKESFRCRALCVTSNRLGKVGSVPKTAVPQRERPYRFYGYGAKDKFKKHQPYRKKLTEALLKEHCSAVAYVRLQVLTDVCHRLGAAFVQLPTSSLGSGAHAGHAVMVAGQLQVLRALLNKRKFFRQLQQSFIAMHDCGHLMREARQHIWPLKPKSRSL